jgi:hypothetical protein
MFENHWDTRGVGGCAVLRCSSRRSDGSAAYEEATRSSPFADLYKSTFPPTATAQCIPALVQK